MPGPRSTSLIDRLARTECPAFTMRRARRAEALGAAQDPIVWSRASGSRVWDADEKEYVDLTAGFGVAAVGHAHPRVVEAIARQSTRLVHALGDVHPSDVKIELLEKLAALAPWRDARVVLSLSGADAIETALKSAVLATGRPGIVAFEGGYHGLAHGPLAACGFSLAFRAPFAEQLNPHVSFVPLGGMEQLERAWPRGEEPACVLVEPIQGRGGVRLHPAGFLRELGAFCRARGVLVVADEILTGHGRAGARWRSVGDGLVPDLICTGKALGGGMPVSACLGTSDVMKAWGSPADLAIHTGTFFGQPLGCAAALATLRVIEDEALVARAADVGARFVAELATIRARVRDIRGAGLLVGIELDSAATTASIVARLLDRGFLTISAGTRGDVLELTPPLTIDESDLRRFVAALSELLDA
jgi:4-aminobutyrate aminotransferase/(S)-3-amino-2-methylpropionate transaminase